MTTYRRRIGGAMISVACEPEQREQAESLLSTLEELDRRGPRLRPGSRIDFGGAVLTLVGDGHQLSVNEFDPTLPAPSLVPDVRRSLEMVSAQVATLRRTGLEGRSCRLDDTLLAFKGCLDQPRIYLQRSEPSGDGDSGWYVGPVEGPGGEPTPEQLEVLPVARLVALRPATASLLALPVGVLAVLRGATVEAVFDPECRPCWDG